MNEEQYKKIMFLSREELQRWLIEEIEENSKVKRMFDDLAELYKAEVSIEKLTLPETTPPFKDIEYIKTIYKFDSEHSYYIIER